MKEGRKGKEIKERQTEAKARKKGKEKRATKLWKQVTTTTTTNNKNNNMNNNKNNNKNKHNNKSNNKNNNTTTTQHLHLRRLLILAPNLLHPPLCIPTLPLPLPKNHAKKTILPQFTEPKKTGTSGNFRQFPVLSENVV